MSGREEFLAKVREAFPSDTEAADMFGWLFDLRESDPAEYRKMIDEVYAERDRRAASAS